MEKYLYSDRKILENEAELCNDKIKRSYRLPRMRRRLSVYDEG